MHLYVWSSNLRRHGPAYECIETQTDFITVSTYDIVVISVTHHQVFVHFDVPLSL